MDGRVFYVEIDGVEYKDALLKIDISVDIFVNEDGKEIGRVANKGIRDKKRDRAAKEDISTDLEVDLSFDKGQANENEEIKFTITAKNLGPNKATGVYVENTLPDGYSFVNATPSKGTWANDEWTIGDMEVNKGETLVMTAKVASGGNYENKVQIYSNEVYDRFPTNNAKKTGNRVFVIKTTTKTFDSGAKGANLSNKEAKETEKFITENLQKPEMFTADCLAYKNTIEIYPKESTRQAMVDIVQQDDGSGGTVKEKPQNNKEYGGSISPSGIVKESRTGQINDINERGYAEIQIESFVGDSTFHSHPSGGAEEKKETPNAGSRVAGFGSGEDKAPEYCHAPSNKFTDSEGKIKGDIYSLQNDADKEIIRYEFARRKPQKVYIYNYLGVLATLPHEYFVNFKK
ncbi:DUF11 domain-containing protein [Chryseobacterium sp. BIGb0232]|uniref:DUF11 domain-containing protein n=1 Tax=Chryseobacterium sp. BIGb0232 TaxID=2940598 RepID=UPI000F49958F|nr:DUF11 domain-containing protein [Chryseobacterium sp. BIGb0232]MCS4301815.1 putative repeat protein (TIGR01451 family) [Chryseobacterium sp. BIGb0232]ROS19333.1 putative repeat protein (TIGR01451 family) [Chryseobacterium nakagawai]